MTKKVAPAVPGSLPGSARAGQVARTKAKPSTSDDTTHAEAVRRMQAARSWVAENPDAWGAILRMARDDFRHGLPVSIGVYFERLRHQDWSARDGLPTRYDHNLTAALSRLLVAENPVLAPLVERRKSLLDTLEPDEVRP